MEFLVPFIFGKFGRVGNGVDHRDPLLVASDSDGSFRQGNTPMHTIGSVQGQRVNRDGGGGGPGRKGGFFPPNTQDQREIPSYYYCYCYSTKGRHGWCGGKSERGGLQGRESR